MPVWQIQTKCRLTNLPSRVKRSTRPCVSTFGTSAPRSTTKRTRKAQAPVERTLRYSSLAMLAVDRFAGVLWSTTARSALSTPLTSKHNLLLPLVAKSKLSQLKTDAFGLDSLDFLPQGHRIYNLPRISRIDTDTRNMLKTIPTTNKTI